MHVVSYTNVNEPDIHARSQQTPYSSKFLHRFKDIWIHHNYFGLATKPQQLIKVARYSQSVSQQ